jgi:hypothetical protein
VDDQRFVVRSLVGGGGHPNLLWVPTQPPIHRVSGGLSPGIKWLQHEVEHSFPSSGKVKNDRGYG